MFQPLDAANDARAVAVMLHPTKIQALEQAAEFIDELSSRGVVCVSPPDRLEELRSRLHQGRVQPLTDDDHLSVELMVVFGGDGTILLAAEWALPRNIPLLGVNLGHVGFLAELEPHETTTLVQQVVDRDYEIEPRLTVDIKVFDTAGKQVWESFAVNEVSVEKAARERMLEVTAIVDDRPVSRWGCDGVLVSTPTGATAYAFSAGGPVVWPDVEALLLVPLSAHALFARSMVLSPSSVVDLQLVGPSESSAVVWCDGRRGMDAPIGYRVHVERGNHHLYMARLSEQPFANRLVRKFNLPVAGWRGSDTDATTSSDRGKPC